MPDPFLCGLRTTRGELYREVGSNILQQNVVLFQYQPVSASIAMTSASATGSSHRPGPHRHYRRVGWGWGRRLGVARGKGIQAV